MLVSKQKFEDFYNSLRAEFPELLCLSVWNEWDWSNESCEHSVVMSELANEMIRWAEEAKWAEVERFLEEIESAFDTMHPDVVSFICTDFLVTILEVENKALRENIKKLMKLKTSEAYKLNLKGYQEPS